VSASPAASHAAHNHHQRAYFERAPKRRMRPANTRYLNRQVDEALRYAELRAGDRVLEVGCGMGRYTFLLARRGLLVEGLDLSPVLLEWLRRQDVIGSEIPLHCADASDPPIELAGRFDAVLGFFVLHHLDDLDGCFASVARMLAPGGRTVFLEPNPWNPLYYAQVALTPGMHWRAERGLLRMRERPVFTALERAGLADPTVHRFGFLPPFAVNRRIGAHLEGWLERVPFWYPLLPFQLFRARRP
jgi:SAM-dependent methyltransferase